MSSDEQKRFFKDILDEIEIHKDLYRFVEFKSVIAKRKDIPRKLTKTQLNLLQRRKHTF